MHFKCIYRGDDDFETVRMKHRGLLINCRCKTDVTAGMDLLGGLDGVATPSVMVQTGLQPRQIFWKRDYLSAKF